MSTLPQKPILKKKKLPANATLRGKAKERGASAGNRAHLPGMMIIDRIVERADGQINTAN
jgi:hypothetical protein